ncbi:MAG: hypothetical protein D6812_14040, partial [Deltaproteobacteria bacterium]
MNLSRHDRWFLLAVFLLASLAASFLARLAGDDLLAVAEEGASIHGVTSLGLARHLRAFEANVGQFPPQVRFAARERGMTLFLLDREIVIATRRGAVGREDAVPGDGDRMAQEWLRLSWPEHPLKSPSGLHPLPGVFHYLIGEDAQEWVRNVPRFEGVRYGGEGEAHLVVERMEEGWRLRCAPPENDGSKALLITLRLDAPEGLEPIEAEGNTLRIGLGETAISFLSSAREGIRFSGRRMEIPLTGPNELRFSTLLGGAQSDIATGIALDPDGNVVVVGKTASLDFPTTGGQTEHRGGTFDAFLARISGDGSRLLSATFLGGSNSDEIAGVAL